MLTRQLLTYRIDLVGSVLLAFIFTLADAFESTVVGQFPIRFAFWLLMIIPLWLTTAFFIKFLLSSMSDETLFLTTTLLVMATTVTSMVAAVYTQFLWHKFVGQMLVYGEILLAIVPITLIVAFSRLFLARSKVSSPDRVDSAVDSRGGKNCEDLNRLLWKIPSKLGHELTSVHAQDHYVHVYTRVGDCLLLMRFDDAISALPPDVGLQVHRSHWVSYEAAIQLDRFAGRYMVQLYDGRSVPVSRRRLANVRRILIGCVAGDLEQKA